MVGVNQIWVGQRRWNSKNSLNPSSSMVDFISIEDQIPKSFFQKTYHQANWYQYNAYIQEIKYQTKPCIQNLTHHNKNQHQGMMPSSLVLEMGSCSSSFYSPSVRTAVNRALFWISVKLHWKDVEFSDHQRSTIKTTVTWERQTTPADSLRQRVRSRLDENPNTMGIIWTSPGNVTTAVTITMEHI